MKNHEKSWKNEILKLPKMIIDDIGGVLWNFTIIYIAHYINMLRSF